MAIPIVVRAEAHDFTFGDIPQLKSEYDVMGVGDGTVPNEDGTDYVVETVNLSTDELGQPVNTCLNHLKQPTRTVFLSGKRIVIQSGHANGLYERYFDGSHTDIKQVTLAAEYIEIRGPMRVPGGHVTVYAMELILPALPGMPHSVTGVTEAPPPFTCTMRDTA